MPNTEQIVRQLDILRTLVARRYGVTLKELAELYDVTQRTISRDLDDLSEAGFPIYPDRRGNKNYWHLEPYKQMPPLNFPIEEIIALTFIEGMISPLEGPSFKEEFKKTNFKKNHQRNLCCYFKRKKRSCSFKQGRCC